jgi:carbon monoxide dehydrogenase subunit G
MKIENTFAVGAPVDRVFGVLSDINAVAPCMPGATIIGEDPEGGHRGRFKIKVGPVSAAYEGRIAIESADAERGEIVMSGSGADPRGAGSAEATITATLRPSGAGTEVVMGTELDIAGRLAQFGGRSSMMQGIADRMIGQFADRLQAAVTADPAAAAAAPATGAAAGATTAGAPRAAAAPAAEADDAFDAGGMLGDMLKQANPVSTGVIALLLGIVLGMLLGRTGPRA